MYIRSLVYPLAKWLAETDADCKRSFLSFWQKRVSYTPEEEYEFSYHGERMEGATEAVLSDSFVISPCLKSEWESPELNGEFFSLKEDTTQELVVPNLYKHEQLLEPFYKTVLSRYSAIKVQSYEELWRMREKLFPHLVFCPSVEKNLSNLEFFYINQVVKKLTELEQYCADNLNKPFDKDLLTKTTPETEATLQKYKKEHTFWDEERCAHLASWHMRFTGIPGRIFFVPEYKDGKVLVCYIGEKLPNVTYH